MRATVFLLTSSLLISCFYVAKGQDKVVVAEECRRETQAINADKSLKKLVLTNEEYCAGGADGGCELTGFYKGGDLKKIVSWVGFSTGNEIFELYFKNDELFFVSEAFNAFAFDERRQIIRHDSTERTFTGAYWFVKGKLIDYSTIGHNRFENDELNPQKVLLAECAQYKRLLASKLKRMRK